MKFTSKDGKERDAPMLAGGDAGFEFADEVMLNIMTAESHMAQCHCDREGLGPISRRLS